MVNDAGDVMLFEKSAAGVYEFHWLKMQTKGRAAIDATLDAFDQTFLDTGCALIFGLIPDNRRDSKFMARWIGAKSLGSVPTDHGICELFIMTREMRKG